MYYTGQGGPERFLGGPGTFQEQSVLEIVTRAARYRVGRRTLGAPRFLRCHASRQHHRVDETKTVAVATRLVSATRRARVPPLAPRPRPSRPHIIIIAPLRSRFVPILSSFLTTTLDLALPCPCKRVVQFVSSLTTRVSTRVSSRFLFLLSLPTTYETFLLLFGNAGNAKKC